MGKIADAIAAYKHGDITLDDAADQLGSMTEFPPVAQPSLTDLLGAANDPYGVSQEDDGHELTSARNMGVITPEEYAKLYAGYSGARRAAGSKLHA